MRAPKNRNPNRLKNQRMGGGGSMGGGRDSSMMGGVGGGGSSMDYLGKTSCVIELTE